MITQKERLEILEKFMWRMNYHRTVTMNEKLVFAMLALADMWVYAHGDKNGELSEKEIKKNIDDAYEKLKTLP